MIFVFGCSSGSDIHAVKDASSLPISSVDGASLLPVLVVAKKHRATGRSEYMLGFRNASTRYCNIRRLQIKRADHGRTNVVTERVSATSVGPNDYGFVIATVSEDESPTDSEVFLNFDSDGVEYIIRARVDASAVIADCVTFPKDLSNVSIVARFPSGDVHHPDHVSDCKINGTTAHCVDTGTVREAQDVTAMTFRLEPQRRFEHGEALIIELESIGGKRLFAATKVFCRFFAGATEFDSLLRATCVATTREGVELAVYNESDFHKRALMIDHVRVDGVDVSAKCTVPIGPLPPDYHNYESDLRFMRIPMQWDATDSHLVGIGFHRLDPASGHAVAGDSQNILWSVIRRGMPYAIGYDYDPYLPGCVCVHNGGLRPTIDAAEIARRTMACASVCGRVPVYATMSNGVDADGAADMGGSCDFMVVSPPGTSRTGGRDAIRESISFYDRFRESGVPFVTSVTPDAAISFSTQDFHWCTLLALCEGSRGALVRQTPDSDTELARSSVSAVGSILEECRQLESSLAVAEKVDVATSINQEGVHTGILFCGTDELLVFALNEWCTRSSRQAHEPFCAVARSGVEVQLTVGEGWDDAIAVDALHNSQVLLTHVTKTCIQWTFPSFEIGSVIRIYRKKSSFRSIPAIVGDELRRNIPLSRTVLYPSKSPFLNLGWLEVGSNHRVELLVKNSSLEPVTAYVKSVGDQASKPAVVEFPPIEIPAHGGAVLSGNLSVPYSEGTSVTRLQVYTDKADAAEFDAFIDLDARIALRAEPEFVDFGRYLKNDKSEFKEVSVRSEYPRFRIENVSATDVPATVVISGDRKSFRFKPEPAWGGQFTGRLKIQVVVPELNDDRRSLALPFSGESGDEVTANPARLVLYHSLKEETRIVRLRHRSGQPISITKVDASVPWISVRESTPGTEKEASVELQISPCNQSTSDSWLNIQSKSADGQQHLTSLNVKFIGVPASPGNSGADDSAKHVSDESTVVSQIAASPANDGIPPPRRDPNTKSSVEPNHSEPKTEDVVRQVKTLLNKASRDEPPPGMPNWLKIHHLLTLGDNAFSIESPAVRNAFDGVLKSESRRGPFAIRRGQPLARQAGEGDLFDHEHHRNQFLQKLSMSGVPLTATLIVDEKPYLVRDLLENSMRETRASGELAWSVTAFSYYQKPGDRWQNKFGEPLSIANLVESLLKEENATCGGTHQYLAMARLLSRPELKKDDLLAKLWPRLERKVEEAVQSLRTNQTEAGDFRLPADLDKQLKKSPLPPPNKITVHYSGHSLEWLVFALPPAKLKEAWVLRAVQRLAEAVDAEFKEASAIDFQQPDQCYYYGFQSHAVSGLSRWHSKTLK